MSTFVIDKNPIHRRTMAAVLHDQGLQDIRECASAEEAYRCLQHASLPIDADPVDLIVLDWALPREPTLALLNYVRVAPKTRSVPVIAVSNNAYARDVISALAAGVDEFVVRPFSRQVVEEKLEAIMARKDAASST